MGMLYFKDQTGILDINKKNNKVPFSLAISVISDGKSQITANSDLEIAGTG